MEVGQKLCIANKNDTIKRNEATNHINTLSDRDQNTVTRRTAKQPANFGRAFVAV